MSKNGTILAPKLFSDVHMRRAFSYALNLTKYNEEIPWNYGENTGPQASWWLRGMKPDYENKSLIPHDINLTMVEEELKDARVWEQGFEATWVYSMGSDISRQHLLGDSIAAVFANINMKFNVTVVGVGWPEYKEALDSGHVPINEVGWLADFGDPENLARTYMHSKGGIASGQKYNDSYVDYLVDLGLSQPDGPERNATYQELQYIYWRDIPGFCLWQPVGRRWSREWVEGWYYNPMYPGPYYYDLYKTAVAPGPNDGGGRVFDFLIPIVAFGTIVITITVGAIINSRLKKKESATAEEESGQGTIQNSCLRYAP